MASTSTKCGGYLRWPFLLLITLILVTQSIGYTSKSCEVFEANLLLSDAFVSSRKVSIPWAVSDWEQRDRWTTTLVPNLFLRWVCSYYLSTASWPDNRSHPEEYPKNENISFDAYYLSITRSNEFQWSFEYLVSQVVATAGPSRGQVTHVLEDWCKGVKETVFECKLT